MEEDTELRLKAAFLELMADSKIVVLVPYSGKEASWRECVAYLCDAIRPPWLAKTLAKTLAKQVESSTSVTGRDLAATDPDHGDKQGHSPKTAKKEPPPVADQIREKDPELAKRLDLTSETEGVVVVEPEAKSVHVDAADTPGDFPPGIRFEGELRRAFMLETSNGRGRAALSRKLAEITGKPFDHCARLIARWGAIVPDVLERESAMKLAAALGLTLDG